MTSHKVSRDGAHRFTHVLAIIVAVLVVGTIILRERTYTTSAADAESITWGATGPSWSPDGNRLAFSVFGSIWQVAAQGGLAEQVSTSTGYHAHPAWSPEGDKIVFISGGNPRGRLSSIFGKLMLVDIATGAEQELITPYQTAGSPSWSPDGSMIVCGLSVPNAGSLLHRIDVSTGEVTQLHFAPQRSAVGRWSDTAWNPKYEEIYFTSERTGPYRPAWPWTPSAQIWTLPSTGDDFIVQRPLTQYKPEDLAFPGRLSVEPDGSGLVFGSVEVNGRGNYELYRLPRDGGQPVAITTTIRDEFDPAVSPDGRQIAHVSNELDGNLDLFTMLSTGGEKRHVRIPSLKFRNPSGRVRVRVVDELRQPTAVRLYVRASDGKAYCPQGQPIYYHPLDTDPGRDGFFVAGGDDTFPAPAGRMELVALKGIEYRIAERSIEVAADQTTEVTITMERWTNWMHRGWFSGENHFHANYHGQYYQRPFRALAWLRAEDLNVANMIVANDRGAALHDKEFFTGAVDPISTERYVLYWGQEYRNSDPLGHMGFLNLKKLVPPYFTSVVGSNSPYDFPLNTMAAMEARKQGGLVTYMHPVPSRRNDVFDTNLGAKELPVTAALGALDAVDILPNGGAAYTLWYHLLNAGFKISPGAGTDVVTNWRGMGQIPGGSREYVYVGLGSKRMDWESWLSRLRDSQVFVTNGPLLTFSVNGQAIGSEIPITSGQPYRARLVADVQARVPLASIEFIENGRVIESRELNPNLDSFHMEKEVEVSRSSWFAARVIGPPARGVVGGTPMAHSGAVYVTVDRNPVLLERDIAILLRWVDRLWAYLEERNNFGPRDNRERARRMIDQAREHYKNKLAKAREQ